MWDFSSIVLCFTYIILSHTKQQTIPMSCFLGSLVITLEVEIEQRGDGDLINDGDRGSEIKHPVFCLRSSTHP